MDNDEYVKRVLTGDMTAPPEKAPPKEKSDKKERERSADRRKKVGFDVCHFRGFCIYLVCAFIHHH